MRAARVQRSARRLNSECFSAHELGSVQHFCESPCHIAVSAYSASVPRFVKRRPVLSLSIAPEVRDQIAIYAQQHGVMWADAVREILALGLGNNLQAEVDRNAVKAEAQRVRSVLMKRVATFCGELDAEVKAGWLERAMEAERSKGRPVHEEMPPDE